jgi:MerR family mercuric resistance operon transcriptional regulator
MRMRETPSHRTFTISRLASEAGVNVETVRYYHRRGLLPQPARPASGVRRYAISDAERLRFIKRAQAMGFTLEEIKSLLELRTNRTCHATRALAIGKLEQIEMQIENLRRLRDELAGLVEACNTNSDDRACPVIQRLDH